MHLKQHADMTQPGLFECGVHSYHRALNDISAGSLDGGIDRRAFGAGAFVRVLRIDPREPGLPAEERFGIALLANALERVEDVFLNPREALEIGVDHLLGFFRLDLEAASEAPARNAVQDGEVDGLGARSRIAGHFAEHLGRGARMDVLPVLEGFAQGRHLGHVRGEPQLDLRIVGSQQDVAFLGDEGIADLATDFGADGNVLQVRVGRGESPGLGADEAVAGVDAAGLGIDRFLQRIGIGRLQLGQLAPLEHLVGDIRTIAGKPFEYRLIGRILPALALFPALVAKLVEQNFSQLLGAADGKFLAGEFVDLALQAAGLGCKLFRKLCKAGAVHLDAMAFHPRHHRDQRSVDAFVDFRPAFDGQAALQMRVQAPGHVGILGGIFGRLVERDFGEGDGLLARPTDFLETQAGVAEVTFGQLVHAMAAPDPAFAAPGIEREADDHRIVDG